MSTNYTTKRTYFLKEGADANRDMGESVNDIVADYPKMKRDIQASLDAILLLKERMFLTPSSTANTGGGGAGGGPLVPPTPQLFAEWASSARNPQDLDISWQAVDASVGVTSTILSINDVAVTPSITYDPMNPKVTVNVPLTTNPLVKSVKVSLQLVNAAGPSYKAVIFQDYVFPAPRLDYNLQTISLNPTILRLRWDAPVGGPPALGYAVYENGIKVGETSNVAAYQYWNVQSNPNPNAPSRRFEVKALFSLPESIYASSNAFVNIS
jgi:hypothetical protein